MQFQQIIGQEGIKKNLTRYVREGRIPHAMLFCGNSGVGKLPMAMAFAQYLCCENPTENDSCGKCPSCIQAASHNHPDIHFTYPIVKSSNHIEVCKDLLPAWREMQNKKNYFSIKDWLSFINAENKLSQIYSKESEEILQKLSYKSYTSEYKVMIIWLAEKMNEACANKLLKLLEEPPEKTIFILTTEHADHLLTTINSRTQNIQFPPIATINIKEHLLQEFNLEKEEAFNIARIARGSYTNAQEIALKDLDFQRNFELYRKLFGYAYKKKIAPVKIFAEEMSTSGREQAKLFLAYAQRITRECFIAKLEQKELNYMLNYEQEFAKNFSKFVHEQNIEDIILYFSNASEDIERNINVKIVFFDLGLKLMTKIK